MSKHVVFLHIPKAGGNSLRAIIQREYKVTDLYYQGTDQDRFDLLQERIKEPSYNSLCHIGHVYFGFHEFFPNDEVKYITMLRDPVKRVISLYNFIKAGQAGEWLKDEIKELSFSEYLRSGLENDLENSQTRRIAGLKRNYDNVGFGKLTDDAFQEAIHNINEYFVTPGLQEHFDDSILLWHQQLQWKKLPFYVSKNITKKNHIRFKDVSQEDLKMIRDMNEYDIKLYDETKKRFDQDFEKLKNPKLKLKMLKFGNEIVTKMKR